MRPVFFSVASGDVAIAERLWARLGSDLVYLYSKTREQGVDFWPEIEGHALPSAKAIVIFWSKNFASSPGTQREMALAERLYKSGQLRYSVILRLDDYPLAYTAPSSNLSRPVS